eukprot:tig00000492_g1501.t1
MCFSAEVSLGSFLAIAASSAGLWRRALPNDRWVAGAGLHYGLVQLLEFFAWRGGGPWVGKALWYVIATEPLAATLAAFLERAPGPRPSPLHIAVVCIFTLVFLARRTPAKGPETVLAPCCDSRHLQWPWAEKVEFAEWCAFAMLLAAPFAMHARPRSVGKAYTALTLGTFAWSTIAYNRERAIGSMWCLVGGLATLLAWRLHA